MSDRAFEPGRSGSPPSADVAPAHAAAAERSPAAEHELSVVSGRRAAALRGEIEIGRTDDPRELEAHRRAEEVSGVASPGLMPRASVSGGGTVAPPIVHEALRSPGTPLDSPARALYERRLGAGLSGVRIHEGATAAASARAVHAAAYTVGDDVVFAAGRYSLETNDGRRLLAHELTHVIQQRAMQASTPPVVTGVAARTDTPATLPLATVAARTPLLQRQDLSTPIVNTSTPAVGVSPTPAHDALEVWRQNAQKLLLGSANWQRANWVDYLTRTSSNPRLSLGDSELVGEAANAFGNLLTGPVGEETIERVAERSAAALGALIGTAFEPGVGTAIGFVLGVLIESATSRMIEYITGVTEHDVVAADATEAVRVLIAQKHTLLAAEELEAFAQLEDQLREARLYATQASTQAEVDDYAASVASEAALIPAPPPIDDDSLSRRLLTIWVLEHAGKPGAAAAGVNAVQWEEELGRVFDGATSVENEPRLFAYQTRAEWAKAGLDHAPVMTNIMRLANAVAAAPFKDSARAPAMQGVFHNKTYDIRVKDPEAFVRYVDKHQDGGFYFEETVQTVREGRVWVDCKLHIAVSRGSAYISEWTWSVTVEEVLLARSTFPPGGKVYAPTHAYFDVWPTWD